MTRNDHDEFEQYAVAAYPRLVRVAFLMTGNLGNAEDLVQNALLRTLGAWKRISGTGDIDHYVYRVLVNAHISARRRRWWLEIPTGWLPDRVGPDPYRDSDDRDMLHRALAVLSARQRAVIVLRYYQDMTEAAAADVLGCSVGTVKTLSWRALSRMRAHLTPAFPDELTAIQAKGATGDQPS